MKAKEPENPLESTIVEVEEKEKENNARLSLLPQCPLPSAVYKVITCRLSTLVLILSPGQFRGGRKGGARQGELESLSIALMASSLPCLARATAAL